MTASTNLVALRQLLAERFPGVRSGLEPTRPPARWPTGVSSFDAVLGGGLAAGAITELVGSGHGSGSAQVIHALLRRVAAEGRFLALVDGQDSFDVDGADPAVLPRLLWVRCRTAAEALKATDLLLRDRNFPFVVLDLKLNPAAQLRRLASSVWHRFARLAEVHDTALVVVTPETLVGGAAWRVRVTAGLGIAAVAAGPAAAADRLRFEALRGELAAGEESVATAG